jgi:hypothetical protein
MDKEKFGKSENPLISNKSKGPHPMKTLKLLSAITSLVSICFASQAITVLDITNNPANGHDYYLLSTASWTDSETYAQTLGGNLATVNDSAENSWIFNAFTPLIPSGGSLWIGYYDPSQDSGGGTHASNFVWADGESPGYTDWFSGQPDNTGGTEFYTAIRPAGYTPDGSWNDLPDSGGGDVGNIFGVVEVVPEPQSIALMTLGTGVLMSLRRKNPDNSLVSKTLEQSGGFRIESRHFDFCNHLIF